MSEYPFCFAALFIISTIRVKSAFISLPVLSLQPFHARRSVSGFLDVLNSSSRSGFKDQQLSVILQTLEVEKISKSFELRRDNSLYLLEINLLKMTFNFVDN